MNRPANPYLDEFQRLASTWPPGWEVFLDFNLRDRDRLIDEYAFAIPDDGALDLIARYSPIVEIGAGKGYWAHLLRQMGVDIVAYDNEPPADAFTEVLHDECGLASAFPGHALFLCWPPTTRQWPITA